MAITDRYDIIIGLEVHCQLNTESKLFCSCPNKFGAEPNQNTCPTCLGMPGTLPVLNQKAVDHALKAALAIGCDIAATTKFDRKHYFYPDLPKGYQITQYDEPYCKNGGIEIQLEDGHKKFIKLNRIHIEEDAGKLSHAEDSKIADSIVDLNRAGTPLLEIVTEPVIYSPEEAYAYLTELKQLLQYIGVSNCNMQEGNLRCDGNISLKPKGQKEFGTRVEIKNLNSFKGVQAALEHEAKRQFIELENGKTIIQETRLFDIDNGKSKSMRTKEEANDYRYFPDPDIPRLVISQAWIDSIKAGLHELPQARKKRFLEDYQLPAYDIDQITEEKANSDYFDAVAKLTNQYKEISNWMMGEIFRILSEQKLNIETFTIKPEGLAGLIHSIENKVISKKIAKEEVFPEMLKNGESADEVIARLGLKVESNDDILIPIILAAIAQNPKAVEDFKAGKGKAIGAIIGSCMKATQGKADPATLSSLVQSELEKLT